MNATFAENGTKWLAQAGLRPTRQRVTLAGLLVGDGKKFMAALIVVDLAAVNRTLGGEPFATLEEAASDDRVFDLIQNVVDSIADQLADHERVVKFARMESRQ